MMSKKMVTRVRVDLQVALNLNCCHLSGQFSLYSIVLSITRQKRSGSGLEEALSNVSLMVVLVVQWSELDMDQEDVSLTSHLPRCCASVAGRGRAGLPWLVCGHSVK